MSAFAAFDALEDGADEPWHIDPCDQFPEDEDARQAEFNRQARLLCPGVDIFAVPNAGRRTRWEAAKRKREGMKAGVLDIVCEWQPTRRDDRGVAFLEFKNGSEMPDANQRARLNRYYQRGHACGVFRTAATALEFLRAAGAPFVDRVGRL